MSLFHPQLWQIPTINTEEKDQLPQLKSILEDRLRQISTRFPHAVFASSLAIEDMVITDIICQLNLPLRIITLNTGKLNPETEKLIAQTNLHYHTNLEVFTPDDNTTQQFEQLYGITAIYNHVEQRRECCYIRKIEPLNRALSHAPAWLTGQRRSQSNTRTQLALEEYDQARHITKFNPIFDWTENNVWAYASVYHIPLNDLYQQGYPSIGCEPCTRPVKKEEDIRAGRWWWENKDSKECGLHNNK